MANEERTGIYEILLKMHVGVFIRVGLRDSVCIHVDMFLYLYYTCLCFCICMDPGEETPSQEPLP